MPTFIHVENQISELPTVKTILQSKQPITVMCQGLNIAVYIIILLYQKELYLYISLPYVWKISVAKLPR